MNSLLRHAPRGIGRAIVIAIAICVGVVSSQVIAADSRLADAAEKADWPRVQSLLKEHADANAAQPDGTTALHWAVYHDQTETAQKLLQAGANASAANQFGVTPLSQACANGNGPLVRALLAAHVDANVTLHGGETALMTAARTGKIDPVRALLEAGAKVDAKDRKDQTALMWAAADGNAAVVQVLIDAGADIHTRLKSGFTPMLFAVREGRIEVVKTLLKAGIDANEAIDTKVKSNGINSRNGSGALIIAVENGQYELAVELLKAGANPNDQKSGYTALHALTYARKPNRGDDPDGQPPPTGSGNLTSLQFVRDLVSHGADVNTRLTKGSSGRGKLSLTGATAFLMASKTADLPLMQLLVELGADPLLGNKDGCTPLMAAAGIGTLAPDEEAGTEEECLAAVQYLLSKGADINTVDRNGETAMHGAAYKSLPKMVQLLADKGAKIEVWNQKDKYGWTPLLISQGFRPGNFKPSFDTLEAIEKVMRAAGVTPPPAPPRNEKKPSGYDDTK
ncbi:MAG TPA: ankyrin repeat domain-containing protein [Tepidisphaeraceae bacterium]